MFQQRCIEIGSSLDTFSSCSHLLPYCSVMCSCFRCSCIFFYLLHFIWNAPPEMGRWTIAVIVLCAHLLFNCLTSCGRFKLSINWRIGQTMRNWWVEHTHVCKCCIDHFNGLQRKAICLKMNIGWKTFSVKSIGNNDDVSLNGRKKLLRKRNHWASDSLKIDIFNEWRRKNQRHAAFSWC